MAACFGLGSSGVSEVGRSLYQGRFVRSADFCVVRVIGVSSWDGWSGRCISTRLSVELWRDLWWSDHLLKGLKIRDVVDFAAVRVFKVF